MGQRVVVFIDGSNFYHGLKASLGHPSINFQKFSQFLVGDRELIRTYYYNVVVDRTSGPERYKKQQRFFNALQQLPQFHLTFGRLVQRGETWTEKGVDVQIAVDMLAMAFHNAYDVAILVSGDGDFAAAVEEVKRLGKIVEYAYFDTGRSRHLQQACDKFHLLNSKTLKKCLM